MKLPVLALGVWGVSVALCQPGPSRPPSPKRTPVSISRFAFDPLELTVSLGDTVVWVNADPLRHTATADSGAWSSPELSQGQRFVHVPNRVGRFPYHCAAHPVMRAVVVVRD
ncbi:MAG: hypothetical protein WD825_09720 [Gemmatimonadaceae bacterium]